MTSAEQLAASILEAKSAETLDWIIRIVLRRPTVQRTLAKDGRLITHLQALLRNEDKAWQITSLRLLGALGHYQRVDATSGRLRSASRPPLSPHGIRVLALDGGGTRALLTIEMLKALEAQTGKKVHELFDVIGGTSTGGLLAAGIQERMPLDTLEQLYLDLAKDVFVKTTRTRRYGQLLFTGATYKAHALEQVLKRVLPGANARAGLSRSPQSLMGQQGSEEGHSIPADASSLSRGEKRESEAAVVDGAAGRATGVAAAGFEELPWFERRMEQV